jgi:pseudouridylate synthase
MLLRRCFGARRISVFRGLSSLVQISPEVSSALAARKPVVALESTIITHGIFTSCPPNRYVGMPYPRNLETAVDVENIIRKHGAIPATIGCVNGNLRVGMTLTEIETLAAAPEPAKISRRDFAVVTARRLTGGTTIAGTMVLAHMAGIKVFATGV